MPLLYLSWLKVSTSYKPNGLAHRSEGLPSLGEATLVLTDRRVVPP